MKTNADLVQGWLLKAESDIANAKLCLVSKQSLDTACFHAQQAAERCIKAFLTANDIEFPFIHNLEKLLELCASVEPAFAQLKPLCEILTPYAVALRYDNEFWPSEETAQEALNAAESIRDSVRQRLLPEKPTKDTSNAEERPDASETPLD